MEKKLSNEQIDQLFLFTKKKYVHFYDLQVELVDHLASSIEDEMAADSKLNFEEALQKVYARFGIFGFAKVVQERQHALAKKNFQLWKNEIKNFFTIPKIALTAAIFFGSLYAGQFLSPEAKVWVVLIFWVLTIILVARSFFVTQKTTTKNLMLTQYSAYTYFPGHFIPYAIIHIDRISNNWLFAGFMIIVFILEFAILGVNKKVWKKAEELYPEAFINSTT